MNTKHVELLQRLEQFQMDSPEASLPFSARLARENHWSPTYARRVIAEYKRFAFLAIAAGHPVSPSEVVDQAWHLHLTYSENYWKVFCPEILGQPFHHHPTRGGENEHEKFQDWYARTLKSYELYFNEPAPADIWPSATTRRAEKHDFIRVDRTKTWVISKPRIKLNRTCAVWLGLLAIAVFCSGAVVAQDMNIFNWRGQDFLAFYIFFFPACFGLAFWLRWKMRVPAPGTSSGAPEVKAYSAAYLNGGKVLTVNTAIANLINQKALHVDAKSRRLTALKAEPPFEHELERVVYDTAAGGSSIAEIRSAAKPVVAQIASSLMMQGLVVDDGAAQTAVAIPLLIALVAAVVGVIKICVGVSRDKPVGFLVVLCLLSLAVSLITLARRPARSRYGDEVLKQLQERHVGPKQLGRNVSSVSPAEFATVMGLFGMNVLVGTELGNLRSALQPPPGNGMDWSSSCGSGCGGGGGGGGGGCGGCGGGGH
jgi:uncharacterized protein (TIGR04222 family)